MIIIFSSKQSQAICVKLCSKILLRALAVRHIPSGVSRIHIIFPFRKWESSPIFKLHFLSSGFFWVPSYCLLESREFNPLFRTSLPPVGFARTFVLSGEGRAAPKMSDSAFFLLYDHMTPSSPMGSLSLTSHFSLRISYIIFIVKFTWRPYYFF